MGRAKGTTVTKQHYLAWSPNDQKGVLAESLQLHRSTGHSFHIIKKKKGEERRAGGRLSS